MKTKVFSLILCIVFICTLFIGCGSDKGTGEQQSTTGEASSQASAESKAPAEKTVITVLRPGDEVKVKKWLEPAKEEFNKANSDIEIQTMYEAWGGWIQKYPTLMKADTQPDVIFWWDNQLMENTVSDKLVPMEELIDKSVLDLYPKNVLDIGKINGKQVYLPQTVDPFMLFYRKDIFQKAGLDPEKPPKTWDELLSCSKTIYEKTGIPALGVTGKTGMNTLQEWMAIFYHQATGKTFLDENNKPIFNTPEALKAFEFVKQLQKYSQPGPEQYARGDIRPLFRDGKVAMTIDSSWTVPDYQAKFGADLTSSVIGIAQMPQGAAGKIDWAGTNGWIITRKDKAEAAGKVISFLASKEQLYLHHTAYGSAPLLDYEKEQSNYKYAFWNQFTDAITQSQLFTMIGRNHPTPKAFYVELEDVWQQFLLGKLGAKDALNLAEKKVNDLNTRAGVK